MVDRYVIYFSILSVVGYVYECFAMTIWEGKWDNRGFLFGPAIPIYGAGALFGTILFTYFIKDYKPMTVFLIGMAASAVLEYSVHYVLEQIFHAYWWDYSKAPLNINGRISLLTSLGFGIAGLVVVYVMNPYVLGLLDRLSDLILQIMALIFIALFSADLTLTISVLSSFIERVENFDEYINQTMDDFVASHMSENLKLNDRFYSAMDKIDDVRRKLINDRIDKAARKANVFNKMVLYRVRYFVGEHSATLNRMLNRIKGKKDE